jgi:dipeptidyl aminopeptidase/acylaminoacyl peptidase
MTSKKWCLRAIGQISVWIFILLTTGRNQDIFAQTHSSFDIITNSDTLFFDREIGLHVQGLHPSSETIITVSTTDAKGQSWWSQNVYISDKHGEVDPSLQRPIRGTYSGIHSMGPFWSMVGGERFHTSSSTNLYIKVSDESGLLTKHKLKWLSPLADSSVAIEGIRHSDLVANLYLPKDRSGPVPVIIVLGGSGGGFNSERASLLATHGYAALDVAYFGVQGTPKYFVETMPLEYFMGAVNFLKKDPRIDTSRIAVMGKSYGAQLSLLLACYESRIKLVIVEAPSSFITGTSATYPVGAVSSAWSLHGKPFPFLQEKSEKDGPVSPAQITISTSGERALEENPAANRAAIPAEEINGPVLLISGKSDSLWPSTVMAEQLSHRMKANGFEYEVKHISYPDAGHNMGGGEQAYGVPNLPPKDRGDSRGGTREGNSIAGAAAWKEVLAFLQAHF